MRFTLTGLGGPLEQDVALVMHTAQPVVVELHTM